MPLVSRLRALSLRLFLFAYLSVQGFALVHEYAEKAHPAGELCGLCLATAQADKVLAAAVQAPTLPAQSILSMPDAALESAKALRHFHPARAPPYCA